MEADADWGEQRRMPSGGWMSPEWSTVFPIYLAVDLTSETGTERHLESVIRSVRTALVENPLIADSVQVCILTYASDASVLMPLSDLTAIDKAPRPRHVTRPMRFQPVFELLSRTIKGDIRDGRRAANRLFRPVVLMEAGSLPFDTPNEWEPPLSRLRSSSGPRVVLLTPEIEVANLMAKLVDDVVHTLDPSALPKLFAMVSGSVVSSYVVGDPAVFDPASMHLDLDDDEWI